MPKRKNNSQNNKKEKKIQKTTTSSSKYNLRSNNNNEKLNYMHLADLNESSLMNETQFENDISNFSNNNEINKNKNKSSKKNDNESNAGKIIQKTTISTENKSLQKDTFEAACDTENPINENVITYNVITENGLYLGEAKIFQP
jgi:hypothetical protein